MKQTAEPYELVYTVKQEDDLYSPLREGTIDETRLKKAFDYWFLELEAEHRAQRRLNLRGALLIFLAG